MQFTNIANLKLSTKAFLATFIPLLINIAWLTAMWNNSSQIQRISEGEKRQAAFVESINELTQQYFLLQGDFFSAFMAQNAHQLALFKENYRQFKSSLNAVDANAVLLTNQKESLEDLGKLADLQAEIVRDSYAAPNEDKLFRFMRFRKQLQAMLLANFDEKHDVRMLVLPQREELDRLRRQEEKRENAFLILLISGVSANLVITVFFHLAYSRYITFRVNKLVVNAKALSQKDLMLAAMSGQDDFAIVDAALHDSAERIKDAFEQKRALMQMIAHDLKSPLASSQVVLETMLRRDIKTLTEAGVRTVDGVVKNNVRLLSLINDLLMIDALELGRLELTIEPEDISKCVREAVETLSATAASRNISINTSIGDDVGLFDYRRILQVLINLLSNAIKFSDDNSQVFITCDKTASGKLKVSVIDRGKGIAKRSQPKIFQRFFQAEEGKRASGTGLGLAISKLIVESHNEQIGFESQEFRGSRFWFTIPDGEAD